MQKQLKLGFEPSACMNYVIYVNVKNCIITLHLHKQVTTIKLDNRAYIHTVIQQTQIHNIFNEYMVMFIFAYVDTLIQHFVVSFSLRLHFVGFCRVGVFLVGFCPGFSFVIGHL